MDKFTIFNQYPFFNTANEQQKTLFSNAGRLVSLPQNTILFHENDACDKVALIGKGTVRVFKLAETGREITLYSVSKGESCILTSLCMLSKKQHMASAMVEEEVLAVIFPAAVFNAWVEEYPLVRKLVFETLASRTLHLMTLIEEITFGKMDIRLANFLLQQFANQSQNSLIITHEQIAIELGTVREVISRLLKTFEIDEKAIKLSRGKITLLNQTKLQKLAQLY